MNTLNSVSKNSGAKQPLQGIGFALSSSDVLTVLQKFFPNVSSVETKQDIHKGKGRVSVGSDVDGADIYIDGRLVGEAPASFSLSSGQHKIEVKDQTGQTWMRELEILDDSDVKLTAHLATNNQVKH